GIRKFVELHVLELARRILNHTVHQGLAGGAQREGGTRFHFCGHDVEITLAIHAIHVDLIPVLVENHDADLNAFGGGGFFANLRDAFGGRQIDGGEVLNLFSSLTADDELLGDVLSNECAG